MNVEDTKTPENRLTQAEEKALCRSFQSGDRGALPRLINAHYAFVTSIARRYKGLGVPVEDLTHEGVLGLIEAARRFDAERSCRFLTYAVFWIRRGILEALKRETGPVRLPGRAWKRVRQNAEHPVEGGLEPPRAVCLSQLDTIGPDGLPPDRVCLDGRETPKIQPSRRRLDTEHVLAGAEQQIEKQDELRVLRHSLQALPCRERMVIVFRYGLWDQPAQTLREIGESLGLSRERVRQIERSAIKRLSRSLRRSAGFPLPGPGWAKTLERKPERPAGPATRSARKRRPSRRRTERTTTGRRPLPEIVPAA